MKRTQLYIEDDILIKLKKISKEQMTTVSDLVRKALVKIYGEKHITNADEILSKANGIWKDRKDIISSEDYVRKIRKNTRRERFGHN